ncbi:MAG: 1-deoxy-D-xylulose-5-phosphate reductoisomerase [Actinomycetota bacterium]
MTTTSKRRIAILGCTGSIGRQAIEVVRAHPERFEIVALAANTDQAGLSALGDEFAARAIGLGDEAAARLAALDEVDVVLNAVVGAAGLRASVAALHAGKVLALANKESMVAGGELCRAAALQGGGSIVPVDSEHAAVAQCLEGRDRASVRRIVLTASGGPFRTRSDLRSVMPAEALAHPTWNMGPKITVDSASMMNKGLEVIEAHHLFGFSYDDIGVVVHPQSVVHGMVELCDGSVLMQAAVADMRIPIQAALDAPMRSPSLASRIDFTSPVKLEFEPLDEQRWPAVALAYAAGRAGGTHPAVLNAANEEAVSAFLAGTVPFVDIARIVEEVLNRHHGIAEPALGEVMEADLWARCEARRTMDLVDAKLASIAVEGG